MYLINSILQNCAQILIFAKFVFRENHDDEIVLYFVGEFDSCLIIFPKVRFLITTLKKRLITMH